MARMPERPEADAAQHERERGQQRVIQDVEHGRHVEAAGSTPGRSRRPAGSQFSITEKTKISTMPSRKNGTADSSISGGTITRKAPGARGQASSAPSSEPTPNEISVAIVSSPSVQGRAPWILPITGSGKSTSDTPRSNVRMSCQ